MSELVAIGLNHKSAPVELREQLAVPETDQVRLLERLRNEAGLSEVMVVSTCNRVEIFGVAARRGSDGAAAVSTLADARGVDPKVLEGHVFVRASGDAARHIFRVAASLESLVVGEPQILGQVKDAYGRAKESGVVGPVLDRCLSLAFKSAKRVRSETDIARGGASVPSVAVDLARSIFGELSGSAVLIVGAGEMAEQAAVHLQAAGVTELVVVNRSADRGERLASKIGGYYEPWDNLDAQLRRADVVVTSTGAPQAIITKAGLKPLMKARRQRPLFFVDIAVPRDVAPDVGKLDHVFLYNVDDLQTLVQENLRSRRGEAERAAALVEEEVHAFLAWMRSRSIGPLMGQLQSHGRNIVETELRKTLTRLGDVSPEQRAVVEQLCRSVMQKILHRPMANVRKATIDPLRGFDGPALAEALAALFELDPDAPAASTKSTKETAKAAGKKNDPGARVSGGDRDEARVVHAEPGRPESEPESAPMHATIEEVPPRAAAGGKSG